MMHSDKTCRWIGNLFLLVLWGGWVEFCPAEEKRLPPLLQAWEDWATWDVPHRNCPTPYHTAEEHLCVWPERLSLTADGQQATWKLALMVFETSWVALPGSADHWPVDVVDNTTPLAVVAREGIPMVQLSAGKHELSGKFRWETMPQRLRIPPQIGLLSLTVSGTPVPLPNWDAQGDVWLQRLRAEVTDRDLLSVQVYRVIEDGIPLWLRTEVELTVSGKSREEDLGVVLPEGWQLSRIDSPVPIAVDDAGQMKAQVRAGKWVVEVHAFLTRQPEAIGYASGVQPLAPTELVAYRANPTFRTAEIDGIVAVDVTQTTFPEKWRGYPVYEWNTSTPFRLIEKMRGMGMERPPGLQVTRRLWLDEDGRGLTYHDRIVAPMQQIWRLDVADGHALGAVRVDGANQLITTNPQTNAQGFEVRARNLNLEATGRIDNGQNLAIAGWQADVDALDVTLSLPPGWRMLALFGADHVDGDWLTAWTLLDLFLLLIFSLAVFRLWGIVPGAVAFLAFGLAYHEPYAPRMSWLFLLVPVALLRVIPEGLAHRLVTAWKYVAVASLAVFLIPFIAREIQSALYPQLESTGIAYAPRAWTGAPSGSPYASPMQDGDFSVGKAPESPYQRNDANQISSAENAQVTKSGRAVTSNLKYAAQAKIQTGPALPEWSWNDVHCVWNGPVSGDHTIQLVMLPMSMHRLLAVVRVALLVLLASIVIGVRRKQMPRVKPGATAAMICLLGMLALPGTCSAQIPDGETLNQLRERLLQKSDAYPNTAEISHVRLEVSNNKLSMQAEIHTVLGVAVPLPGRFPAWSPLSVTVDGQSSTPLVRRDGFLWLSLPAGVHQVQVTGVLPDTTDWEWAFVLVPRRVEIDAPDWTITGVGPNGVPERQVLFSRKQQALEGEATYDRRDFQAIVAVDRYLELGLVWQVRTEVTRLSSTGKALSLRLPLIPGESVISSNTLVRDGMVDVRLGAAESSLTWSSELPVGGNFTLATQTTDNWVERWHLITSPVWNVATQGLNPIFEPQEQNLIPVWYPWPGESVSLSFSEPTPVSGETITVHQVRHVVALGPRQRTSELTLEVEASLGSDLSVELDNDSEVSSLTSNGQMIPVRRDGSRLIVPAKPGRQSVHLEWRTDVPLRFLSTGGRVALSIPSANISTTIHVPDSRWVLWADGPLRGPAVRFWVILACALVAALVLGSLSISPLRRWQWILLVIGLTQVHVVAALVVVGWFFAAAYRGKQDPAAHRSLAVFNLGQIFFVFHTLIMLIILIVVVGEGLLGNPEMFILGNMSTYSELQWFQPRVESQLPEPRLFSISVWFYRLLMLFWALWLAASLINWLKWAWEQFSHGGCWRRESILVATLNDPPPQQTP